MILPLTIALTLSRSRSRTLRLARRVQRLSDAKTAGMLHTPTTPPLTLTPNPGPNL